MIDAVQIHEMAREMQSAAPQNIDQLCQGHAINWFFLGLSVGVGAVLAVLLVQLIAKRVR